MNIVVIAVVVMIVGIVLLSNQSPVKKKTRESFLKELTDLVGGTCVEIPGREKCFQISFNFEGQDFIFEDILDKGFETYINKAYLKAKTPAKLSVSFASKERSMRVKSDILIISDVKEDAGVKKVKVNVPKGFEDLQIVTENPRAVNELFADPKILKIFKEFRNSDNRGSKSIAMKVSAGELILEFHADDDSFSPGLDVLQSNIPLMENYCDTMLIVIKKLKYIENPLL